MTQPNLLVFADLTKQQFQYGGQKYALTETKESTDVLFDDFSYKWLLGTIAKYIKRFNNLKRERDLLKIATYCYILWLKRGFHIKTVGVDEPVNTTVKIKEENFNTFLNFFRSFWVSQAHDYYKDVNLIYEQMQLWSEQGWLAIDEEGIFSVYALAFNVWKENFSEKAGQDTDTYLEKDSTTDSVNQKC